MTKRIVKKREGFALVTTLLTLVIISIFGLAIIGITTSNFKMTKIDSKSQGTYYIAEAGVNQTIYDISKKVHELSNKTLSHDEFFEQLDQYMGNELKLTLNDFEENLGEKPLAEISIKDGVEVKAENTPNYSERVISYRINSKGEIGKLGRTVSTSIEIAHGIEKGVGRHSAFDYVMYSGGNHTFNSAGGANIKGSVYGYDLKFDASNTIIEGSVISEKSVNLISAVKIKGNIYAMDGKVNLSNSNIEMKGDIHATDNVTLSSGTSLDGSIYTKKDVVLNSSNTKVTGDIHSGGKVELGSGANVKDIYTNGQITMSSNNTIDGDLHSLRDVIFGSTANVKNIYTNGNIKFSSNNTINGDINAVGQVGSSDSGNNVKVMGNIFSNSSVITRNYQTYEFLGNVHASDNVENGNGNVIRGDAVSKKRVINRGTINGIVVENGNPIKPQSPLLAKTPNFQEYEQIDSEVPLHNFEIGANHIAADKNSTIHNIVPGSYNNFRLEWNDTIQFTGGNYYFNNINANVSAIKLQLDLSNGPINIYAKENIQFGSGLEVSVSQDGVNYQKISDILTHDPDLAIELAGKVYWEVHKDFRLPENCYFLGTVLANNSFTTGSSAKLIGAYVVNEGNISMGYGPTIIYAPPTISSAGGSGNNGGSNGEGERGQNIIAPSSRIRTLDPIKEK